jgi:electron transport complex protein RnfE
LPELSATLGLYIPLIVVNCIIFARAEAVAFKNGPVLSLADGLGMGLGFTLAITVLASVREIFGSGTLFGNQIMGETYQGMSILTAPSGGFLTLGILLIIVNLIRKKIDADIAKRKEAEA